ncbi:MAG: magnesium transporter, partial [Clostridiaceae bacterium]|nr:magnesium transporter [Clostridiaceae bacterium]
MELERFEEKILALLRAKQYLPLQRYLETLNPADVAECLDDLLDEKEIDWEEDLPRIFRLLPKELASDVFAEMEPELQSKLIDAFSDKELGEVLGDMFLDDTVDVI